MEAFQSEFDFDDEPIENENAAEDSQKDEAEPEPEPEEDPLDIQMRALQSLPIKKLLGLSEFIANEANEASKFNSNELENLFQPIRLVLENPSNISRLKLEMERLKDKMEELRRRRRAIQGHVPVQEATRTVLEKSIQRFEDSNYKTTEEIEQSSTMAQVLETLMQSSNSNFVEAKYKSIHAVPKRQKVMNKDVVQGPDLSNTQERTLKEGLTAEAAAKSERPLIYHKGLQRWIPLPQGDVGDDWRD